MSYVSPKFCHYAPEIATADLRRASALRRSALFEQRRPIFMQRMHHVTFGDYANEFSFFDK